MELFPIQSYLVKVLAKDEVASKVVVEFFRLLVCQTTLVPRRIKAVRQGPCSLAHVNQL